MRKIFLGIILFATFLVLTSCSGYVYIPTTYTTRTVAPKYITKEVLVSHDNGTTFVKETVYVRVENQTQMSLVNDYWRGTPRWIGSPERAYIESGGMYGQYLFGSGLHFYIRGTQVVFNPPPKKPYKPTIYYRRGGRR